jgi:hypothetical protein
VGVILNNTDLYFFGLLQPEFVDIIKSATVKSLSA